MRAGPHQPWCRSWPRGRGEVRWQQGADAMCMRWEMLGMMQCGRISMRCEAGQIGSDYQHQGCGAIYNFFIAKINNLRGSRSRRWGEQDARPGLPFPVEALGHSFHPHRRATDTWYGAGRGAAPALPAPATAGHAWPAPTPAPSARCPAPAPAPAARASCLAGAARSGAPEPRGVQRGRAGSAPGPRPDGVRPGPCARTCPWCASLPVPHRR